MKVEYYDRNYDALHVSMPSSASSLVCTCFYTLHETSLAARYDAIGDLDILVPCAPV